LPTMPTDSVKVGTVNVTALLATPLTVTTTGPVVAPDGTFTTICVSLQLVAVAAVTPLNLTVLAPSVAPKPDPLMVTDEPIEPEGGEIVVISGPQITGV
jgi:hypothetical protein